MKNVLEQLYNGEIYPAEQFAPRSEEYKRLYRRNYSHYEDFAERLSKLEPPLDQQFIKILDEQLDTVPHEFSELFIDGFRLGVKLMVEVFKGEP